MQIYDVLEIADLLRVKPRWVQQRFRTRELRGRRIGKGWQTTGALLLEFLEADEQRQILSVLFVSENGSRLRCTALEREDGSLLLLDPPTLQPGIEYRIERLESSAT